jgi:hypothetical protein
LTCGRGSFGSALFRTNVLRRRGHFVLILIPQSREKDPHLFVDHTSLFV